MFFMYLNALKVVNWLSIHRHFVRRYYTYKYQYQWTIQKSIEMIPFSFYPILLLAGLMASYSLVVGATPLTRSPFLRDLITSDMFCIQNLLHSVCFLYLHIVIFAIGIPFDVRVFLYQRWQPRRLLSMFILWLVHGMGSIEWVSYGHISSIFIIIGIY